MGMDIEPYKANNLDNNASHALVITRILHK